LIHERKEAECNVNILPSSRNSAICIESYVQYTVSKKTLQRMTKWDVFRDTVYNPHVVSLSLVVQLDLLIDHGLFYLRDA